MTCGLRSALTGRLNPAISSWTGRRVWIVGASSGIGAALAQALLEAGAQVAVSARRLDTLEQVVAGRKAALAVDFDAADPAAWPRAFDRVIAGLGGVDLVVLGAARYDPVHSWDFDIAKVEASFNLNVVSVYRALGVVVPHLLAQGHGGIALVGSIAAYTGLPRAMIYGATKAALRNLAESLYFELEPRGLSVYLISPGFVATPMSSVNDFPMPGLLTPPQAAARIIEGFERGRFEIRFPRGFAGAVRWVSRLPERLRFWLLHKATGM